MGFLLAWLRCPPDGWNAYTHVHQYKPTLIMRQQARAEGRASESSELTALFAKERDRRTGEADEPEGFA